MSEVAMLDMTKVRQATSAAYEDNKALFGFWVYIMTDCILFASLFATYAVLHNNNFGGPNAKSLFSLPYALAETLILLTSSFSCGLAILSIQYKKINATLNYFMTTFILGVSFLVMEISEFRHLYIGGNSWHRSGFLSSYFTLVGTHGLHITIGLIWMLIMIWRLSSSRSKLNRKLVRQLTMLSIFWHFLDVIWIFIFSIVYMFGGIGI